MAYERHFGFVQPSCLFFISSVSSSAGLGDKAEKTKSRLCGVACRLAGSQMGDRHFQYVMRGWCA